jgi:CRISPR/Cas system CMR-associated protein Cmr3 (group 5 of RAMP superfamily)
MEWRLFPLDVLLFRGRESMNAGESGVVASLFPPTPETIYGFVRATLLEVLGVDFAAYGDAVKLWAKVHQTFRAKLHHESATME